MPSIQEIQTSQANRLRDLKALLRREPGDGVDKTYQEDEPFSFDDARSSVDENRGRWFGVTAKLYNFAIGEETGGSGSLGNDDVQYVGICKCPSPEAIRTQEYTDLAEKVMRVPDRKFGAYSPLSGGPVRFGVFCNAFNNDSSEAWEGIVSALGGDITNAVNLGLGALPGLSQFATPGAVGDAISVLVKEGLTDEPVEVSGDEIICDTIDAVEWFRKVDKAKWVWRKWMIHTLPNEPAWYLSQWFITLDTAIQRYDYAAVPGSKYYAFLSTALAGSVEVARLDYAALQVLRGEAIEAVAEKFGMQTHAISSAMNAIREASFEEASARVQAALLRTDEFEL